MKRANKNMFLLIELKRAGLSQKLLWNVYNALIRTFLTYSAPTTTNMPARLLDTLKKVEKRATTIIGSCASITLTEFCKSICVKLAKQIANQESHPLRSLFLEASPSCAVLRRSHVLTSPFAHTTRFKNSLIKYSSST